jgi:hypothetical protein
MTELILLGNVAILAKKPIEYDTVSGTILDNAEADKLLHREYRQGWIL